MIGAVADRDAGLQARIRRTGWVLAAVIAGLFFSSVGLILWRWWTR